MTPDLAQLADETIELRRTDIERALTRHHIPAGLPGSTSDHLDRSRGIIAATWASTRPTLTRLANDRRAAIARLAHQGITPDEDCTVTVGRVTLHTVRSLHPVAHRYEVMRGRERAGWAWLSSIGEPGIYVSVVDGLRAWGLGLPDALYGHAERLDAEPLTEAGAP